jgi:uncharacterized protein
MCLRNLVAAVLFAFCAQVQAQESDAAAEAATWRAAADKGDHDAMVQLALMYYEGRGVPRSLDAAKRWFVAPARSGNPVAQHMMAMIEFLAQADRTTPDSKDVKRWLQPLLDDNVMSAQALMGSMLFLEEHAREQPDYAQALSWFLRAAAQGEENAMFQVGFMHLMGYGVPRSLAKARPWIEKAHAKGHGGAGCLVQAGLLEAPKEESLKDVLRMAVLNTPECRDWGLSANFDVDVDIGRD